MTTTAARQQSRRFRDTGRLQASSKRKPSAPIRATVYVVTNGPTAALATLHRWEAETYADNFNKLRSPSHPAAVITEKTIDV